MTGKNSQEQNKGGAPTVIDEDVIRELSNALRQGFTIVKACDIAGIGESTYYDHAKADKKFSEEMTKARKFVEEKARQNVSTAIIEGDTKTSQWYLERKAKDEFSKRTENTGKDGQPLYEDNRKEIREMTNKLNKMLDENE